MDFSKLKKGDKVRVSGGPYYLAKCGKKIKMGERGVGVFIELHPDGKGILVLFEGNASPSYVYVGPCIVSDITGTILRPHKVSKKRPRR